MSPAILQTAIAGSIAGLTGLIWYYWDNPIGSTVRITQKIPKTPDHIPILGSALGVLSEENMENFHEMICSE